ncbi:mandelate racemase/muconate lactonizing enzyme family protein [Roseomonas elaeocarpi]|uniref:Mandelate racemase/muconate lactonizing enzyme family protein n=1 Tax=Roseomonas elaeocarpi TaxID=907779 RepID=A0ABV6JPH2_9PROT
MTDHAACCITDAAFLPIQVTPRTTWCFLRVRTADGRVGLGECTLPDQENELRAAADSLIREIVGESTLERARLTRVLPHAPGGLVSQTLRSGLEQALWDLAAQAADLPLHALLGGALHPTVPLYANINRGAERTPAGFAAAATQAVVAGFRAVKLAPFDPFIWEDAAHPAMAAAYAEGLARVAATRAAVGSSIDLMVDAHWRFSAGGAAALLRDLEEFRLFWLECPLAEANHAEIRRLRSMANARGVRLAGAETLCGLARYRPLVEAGCYDVLMPDIKHCGGHAEMQHIAALAQTAGIEVAPHNPTGPVCHLHSLHAAAVLPNAGRLEVQFGESETFFTLLQGHSLAFSNGEGSLPPAPGLGAELREHPAQAELGGSRPPPWLDRRLG